MAKPKRVPAAKKVPRPKTARKSAAKNPPKEQTSEQTQDTASQTPPPWASK